MKYDGMDKYCAIGALIEVSKGDAAYKPAREILSSSSHALYDTSIVGVNDGRGYDDTLKMFDHAIEVACVREDAQEEVKNG